MAPSKGETTDGPLDEKATRPAEDMMTLLALPAPMHLSQIGLGTPHPGARIAKEDGMPRLVEVMPIKRLWQAERRGIQRLDL